MNILPYSRSKSVLGEMKNPACFPPQGKQSYRISLQGALSGEGAAATVLCMQAFVHTCLYFWLHKEHLREAAAIESLYIV